MRVPQPEIERQRYRQRQMLQSRDFNDQLGVEMELRAWHNRAMHNSYGVVRGARDPFGMRVQLNVAHGTVRVRRGLAYDSYGRPLLLQKNRSISLPQPVPAENETRVLMVRYRETDRCAQPIPVTVCPELAAAAKQESAEFIWMPLSRLSIREGVPLAMIRYGANGTVELDDQFTPPILRPEENPRVALGSTPRGGTDWKPWTDARSPGTVYGLEVRVDMTAQGFCHLPCYFAWLDVGNTTLTDFLILTNVYTHIEEATIYGFTYRMMIPARVRASLTVNKFLYVVRHELSLSWLAVQSDSHNALIAQAATKGGPV
jgi:hypothetical protein